METDKYWELPAFQPQEINQDIIYQWMMEVAQTEGIEAVINILAVIGRWDENPILQDIKANGVNTSYPQDLT